MAIQGITGSSSMLMETNYPTGQLMERYHANKNRDSIYEKHGKYLCWYKSGQKKEQSSYQYGFLQGERNIWYENGKKEASGNYRNGLTHGFLRKWDENGNIKSKHHFVDGELHGKSYFYYANGKLKTIIDYDQGDFSKVTDFYMNGQKRCESDYTSGRMLEWYSNGQKKADSTRINGRKEGRARTWYSGGQKKSEVYYKNGARKGNAITWYRDGSKKSQVFYKEGKKEGISISWYKNGRVMSKHTYENGELNGPAYVYYESGEKKITEHYIYDMLEGESIAWHKNGKKKSQGFFRAGELEGKFIEWDEKGKVISEIIVDQKENKRRPELKIGKTRRRIKVDPFLYDSYTGTYEVEPAYIVTITRDENKLFFQAEKNGIVKPKLLLFPETEKNFYIKTIAAQISFMKNSKGKVDKLLIAYTHVPQPARKISSLIETIEAESMILKGYRVLRHYNGRGIISLGKNQTRGTAKRVFHGPEEKYNITLVVVPEFMGSSRIKIMVNKEVVFDKEFPKKDNWQDWGVDRFEFYIKNVGLKNGDKISLESKAPQNLHARVDKMHLFKVIKN